MARLGDGRHTRQGAARGQRHGTLDREDPDVGYGDMWAATSHTAMKDQGRTRPTVSATVKQNHALAGDGCWCGKSYGHDWPGKNDGTPHPRTEQA